jgi:hypothetical protein
MAPTHIFHTRRDKFVLCCSKSQTRQASLRRYVLGGYLLHESCYLAFAFLHKVHS